MKEIPKLISFLIKWMGSIVSNMKPRGSLVGLKQNREALKVKNTEALLRVIDRLGEVKPDTLWTYKEVWSGAGLKSNVALNSEWNSHIRDAIDAHNLRVRGESEIEMQGPTKKKTLRGINCELRGRVKAMQIERDQALSKIAIFEADAEYYKKKYEDLLMVNERLRSRSGGLTGV